MAIFPVGLASCPLEIQVGSPFDNTHWASPFLHPLQILMGKGNIMFLSVQVTRRARVRVTRHSIPNMVILAMCGGQKTTTNLQIVTAYHSKLGSSTANSMADWLAGWLYGV